MSGMMKGTDVSDMRRRSFFAALAAALSAPLFVRRIFAGQEKPPAEPTPFEKLLSPEEWASVQASPMAMDMDKTYGHGYSCAEAMLLICLKRLSLSEDSVWAAAGCGGGMGQKELCGLLTAGHMGIGLASGRLKIERKAAKKLCSETCAEYWAWWNASFPPRCADIRPAGSSSEVCRRLSALAAVKVNSLIDRLLEIPAASATTNIQSSSLAASNKKD